MHQATKLAWSISISTSCNMHGMEHVVHQIALHYDTELMHSSMTARVEEAAASATYTQLGVAAFSRFPQERRGTRNRMILAPVTRYLTALHCIVVSTHSGSQRQHGAAVLVTHQRQVLVSMYR
jgi:hypothetical protein